MVGLMETPPLHAPMEVITVMVDRGAIRCEIGELSPIVAHAVLRAVADALEDCLPTVEIHDHTGLLASSVVVVTDDDDGD